MIQQFASLVDRAAQLTGSYGRTRHPPERVDAAAIARLEVELVRQEMEDFIRFVYRREGDVWLHIVANGRIPRGVWAPWGSSGKSKLTQPMRTKLRKWMFAQNRPRPVFFYNPKETRWYVDLTHYTNVEVALKWYERCGVTVVGWLQLR